MTALVKEEIINKVRKDVELTTIFKNAQSLGIKELWGCLSDEHIVDLLDFVVSGCNEAEFNSKIDEGTMPSDNGVWCWVSSTKQADTEAVDLSFLLEVNYN